ncbi:MAG: hypothetical protein U9R34_03165 [Nanoarchaeota archaeon]|nr:hypothetical protein [Nanoarchaeota archaeon]
MRKNMKKRGALELSVNSIVIMVIAFVVLGLILTFTRTIFKFGTEKTTGIFEATSLETQPDAENPLTLPDTISVKSGGKKTMNVGYYNRNPYKAENARFGIYDCQDELGQDMAMLATEAGASSGDDIMPIITSASQTIDGSESKGYKVIITDRGLPSGRLYICTVAVYNGGDYPSPEDLWSINPDVLTARGSVEDPVYETKQIFLQIAA